MREALVSKHERNDASLSLSLSVPMPLSIWFEIDFAVAGQGSRCDIKNITPILFGHLEGLMIGLFVTLWGLYNAKIMST